MPYYSSSSITWDNCNGKPSYTLCYMLYFIIICDVLFTRIYLLNGISQNAYIAFRIMLTISLSLVSAEKINYIIKIYLRSTMSQQRLNILTLLSFSILNINYDKLIM